MQRRKERLENIVGPKEVSQEGMMEKKRACGENHRAFKKGGTMV